MTKLDNLVHIAHNVQIGKGCLITGAFAIAGSSKIGDYCTFAGQVGVGNRVNVGDRVTASSKCGIHADVSHDEIVSGFPALPNRLWLRCSANFKKLPEIAKALKKLNETETQ